MSRHDKWRALAAVVAAVLVVGVAIALWASVFNVRDHASGHESGDPGHLNVFAGIPPVAFLVRRIGDGYVHVDVLVPPSQSPHTFEPTPRQAAALARASLFFRDDMPFENRLVERLATGGAAESDRRLTVVDTTAAVAKRTSEGDADEPRGAPDPHVWLAPRALKTMASEIAEALTRADPQHAVEYRTNLAGLTAELDALDARITRTMAPFRGRSFYVFHPAFGYFADAYGLKQQTVETEGKSPSPGQLRELIRQAQADRIKVVFAQPQFDPRSAEAVATAIRGKIVPLDPLAEDVIKNLDDMATKIESAMMESK